MRTPERRTRKRTRKGQNAGNARYIRLERGIERKVERGRCPESRTQCSIAAKIETSLSFEIRFDNTFEQTYGSPSKICDLVACLPKELRRKVLLVKSCGEQIL